MKSTMKKIASSRTTEAAAAQQLMAALGAAPVRAQLAVQGMEAP